MVRSRNCLRDASTQTDSILSVNMLGTDINGVSNRQLAVDSLSRVFLGVDKGDNSTSVGVSKLKRNFVDQDHLLDNTIKPAVKHVVKMDNIETGETHAEFVGANKCNLLFSVAVANFNGVTPENLLFSFYREYHINFTFEFVVHAAHGITSLLQTKRYSDKLEKDQLWWIRFQLISFLFNKIRQKVGPLKNTNRNFLRIGGPIQFWSLYKNAMQITSEGIYTDNTLVATVTEIMN